MRPFPTPPVRAFGSILLMVGLLAGALTSCGVRQRRQAAETAAAAASQATSASTAPVVGAASATPSTREADQLDSQLEALSTALSDTDTLGDLSTALPPDEPTGTPVASAATLTPAPDATAAASVATQGAEIEQMLATMQALLDQADTVPEAANP